MTAIPPEALAEAEAHVLHRITMWRVAANPDTIELSDTSLMARRGLIADALEAAAPLIAAAERDRIRQLAVEHGATYQSCPCDPARGIGSFDHKPTPFADLLGGDR